MSRQERSRALAVSRTVRFRRGAFVLRFLLKLARDAAHLWPEAIALSMVCCPVAGGVGPWPLNGTISLAAC